MTRFELAKVIGSRAHQISQGAPILVQHPPGLTDVDEIARLELEAGKCPIFIRRTLPDGKYEDWSANELIRPY